MRYASPLSILALLSAVLFAAPAAASPNAAPQKGEAGYTPVDMNAPGFRGGVYKFVPPDTPGVGDVPDTASIAVTAPVIFLNPCTNGCTITPGTNDSRTNHSSIVNQTSNISPWPHGQQTWNDTVQCVQGLFAQFNVTVTDVEPSGPHHEAIVAGSPGQAGMPNNVLGVAPFSCGVIHNAITFSFADIASSVQELCSTIGQEVAHGWGLDHEFLCEDPMTYLTGCGAKSFQNIDAQCGEYEARACMCGGTTQNSVTRINNVFGDGIPPLPTLAITEPIADASVNPGFPIRANITDSIGIDRVQFFVNGVLTGESFGAPFVANAPAELLQGAVEVEVVATNHAGGETRQSITVVHGERCVEDGCPEGQACWSGACVNTGAGGLGAPCNEGNQCDTGLCAQGSEGGRCTAECRNGECPSGFECIQSGATQICWEETSGGICSATDVRSGPLFPVLVGLFGVLLLGWRRRSAAE